MAPLMNLELKPGYSFFTDRAGSKPLYYSVDNGRVMAASRAQEVAVATGQTVDPVSAADFIANATVCYPFSLFEGVYHVPPGARVEVVQGGLNVHPYYVPEEVPDSGTPLADWAAAIGDGVKAVLEARLAGLRNVCVLFSGGEDARAVASMLPAHLSPQLVTLADTDNREVRLARRAARRLGYPHCHVRRPPGFYRAAIRERVETVGAGWDIRQVHVYGATADALRECDAIVGGYGADTLFKTACMGNVRRRAGRLLPERISTEYPDHPVSVVRASGLPWLRREIARAVDERRWSHHERLKEFRPRTAGNWHTLWPLGAHRVAYPHYLSCLAIGPRVVEPFIDDRLYAVAARMPDKFRVDREAFRMAFAEAMGTAGWLPTSSGRIPNVGGAVGQLIARAISERRNARDSIMKRFDKCIGRAAIAQGSWSPDQKGFDFRIEELLGDAGAQALAACLQPVIRVSGRGAGTIDAINALPKRERFRAAQIGCLLTEM